MVKYQTTKSRPPTEYFFFLLPIPLLSTQLHISISLQQEVSLVLILTSMACTCLFHCMPHCSLMCQGTANLPPRMPLNKRWDINQRNSSTSPTTQSFTSSQYYHTEKTSTQPWLDRSLCALWHYCFQIKRSIILQCQTWQ